ncbi:inovirus Gp2 family protein [Marinobacter pelagius]|uniref:inovirus Gp2 family protein n=1 Tax=Marinobacter sp. C7 TaxID=2951363 RepID=UPI001EF121D2|nr:inovirus Gp2 family protein [Marinobacter sp. C7]MCG7201470.1 inovirus Gp2 family protein [Marinobacter sp. C7]
MSDNNINRHLKNSNLILTQEAEFNDKQLIPRHHPFIVNYLQRIEETIDDVLNEHLHAIAIRVDLRLPQNFNWENPKGRPLFNRFIDSLKARIDSYGHSLKRNGKRFHPTSIRFLWCREFGESGHPHYHCILFFNKQTFRGLGRLGVDSTGLYGMISKAWCSALGCTQMEGDGLIFVPQNHLYHLRRGEPCTDLFRRASYLAKYRSKVWGLRSHNFGASRRGLADSKAI